MLTPRQRRLTQLCAVIVACMSAVALAQADPELPTLTGSGAEGEQPVLISTGLSSGFPGFNRFSVAGALQYRSFGAQLKLAPTPAGLYFGATLRGYLPFGGFVPLYVGAGGGVYGQSNELHLVFGGHVPVAERVRLDLEAGAARVSSLAGAQWLPWVSLGVSYTFPVTADTLNAPASGVLARSGSRARGAVRCTVQDENSLMAALDQTVDDFITNAAATYGGSYTDLEYELTVRSVNISGSGARIVVHYRGSVRTVLGGGRESASGLATVHFRWDGCNWRRTSLSY